MAVDILAGVGIIALTIVNPVAGAVAAGAYTAYSAANATTGKNIITGRKLSKEERIMEGLSLIPLPGMGFLKRCWEKFNEIRLQRRRKICS